ncbi:hypothetical protein [Paenibacillus sp. DMB20]|uniref:hypothetical protein n=1 Tax=Paenibacillus sp. DMB20 TaxID=1642570 RepID=UPI001F1E626C|nr:hypothetical protein [Paenibacillus sp. DMB20]
MVIRRELEEQARNAFIRKGGKPRNEFPHYMTLEACCWIKEWYIEGCEINIRLDEFNEDSISFTYGDLFPTMRYEDGKFYRKQVYTKKEIMELVGKLGLPQEWNKDGTLGPERYVEVQIWDEDIISKYLKKRSIIIGGA